MASILTNSGRAALAKAVKNSTLHLAWGRGKASWDQGHTDIISFGASGTIQLAAGITNVTLKSADGVTTYAATDDFTVDAKGVISRVATGAIPSGASVQVSYTTPRPPESPARTALIDEIGRKKVTEIRFVTLDDVGEIIMTTGRFSYSEQATRHLLFRTTFAYNEGANETVREIAVILGTVAREGTPPGQYYLLPSDVAEPGIMLLLQHTAPIIRNGATQQSFESVLTL